MALVKKRTVVSRSTIITIVVIVLLAGGYFAYQRFFSGSSNTPGVSVGTGNQINTDFGEAIFNDPRFTGLQSFGHTDELPQVGKIPTPGNPNPFQ